MGLVGLFDWPGGFFGKNPFITKQGDNMNEYIKDAMMARAIENKNNPAAHKAAIDRIKELDAKSALIRKSIALPNGDGLEF